MSSEEAIQVTPELVAHSKEQAARLRARDKDGKELTLSTSLVELGRAIGPGAAGYFVFLRLVMALCAVILLFSIAGMVDNQEGELNPTDNADDKGRFVKLSLAAHRKTSFGDAQVYMHFLVMLCLSFALSVFRFYCKMFDSQTDDESVTPSDFTIQVLGLPRDSTLTNSANLNAFFSRYGRIRAIAIARVIGDVASLGPKYLRARTKAAKYEMLASRRAIRGGGGGLCGCLGGDPKKKWEAASKQAQLAEDALARATTGLDTNKPCGVAFITYESSESASHAVKGCFPELRSTLATYGCTECMCVRKYHGHPILVRRADEPEDVKYENLEVSHAQRLQLTITSSARAWGLTILAVAVQVACRLIKDEVRKDCDQDECDFQTLTALTVLPALISTAISMGLYRTLRNLAIAERHASVSATTASTLSKMSRASLLLGGIALPIIYNNPANWWEAGDLADQVFYNLLSAAFMPVFRAIVWRAVFPKIRAVRNLKKATTAREVVLAVMPPSFNVNAPYADAIVLFSVALFFLPIAPYSMLIALPGIAAQYITNFYILSNLSARPKWMDSQILMTAVNNVTLSTLPYMIGLFCFYIVSYNESDDPSKSAVGWTPALTLTTLVFIFTIVIPLRYIVDCCLACAGMLTVPVSAEWRENEAELEPYLAPTPAQFLERIKEGSHVAAMMGKVRAFVGAVPGDDGGEDEELEHAIEESLRTHDAEQASRRRHHQHRARNANDMQSIMQWMRAIPIPGQGAPGGPTVLPAGGPTHMPMPPAHGGPQWQAPISAPLPEQPQRRHFV